jgi:hypothetical protein
MGARWLRATSALEKHPLAAKWGNKGQHTAGPRTKSRAMRPLEG